MSKRSREQMLEECDLKSAAGFAATSVFPGESHEEFALLVDDIWEQYEPEGPIEEDLVETIANSVWRKRHMGIFHRAFKARSKWGSYFEYPGDPGGFSRITQEDIRRIASMRNQMTAKCVTFVIEKRLGKIAEPTKKAISAAEATNSVAGLAEKTAEEHEAVEIKEARESDATNDGVPPEGILRTIVDKVFAEIKGDCTKGANHRVVSPDTKCVVEEIVKREFAAFDAEPPRDGARTIGEYIEKTWKAFSNAMSVTETALGAGFLEETLEQMGETFIEQTLARFGDILTPECFIEEFRFGEVLDLRIERAHDRLIRVQAQRAKKAAANIVSMQPGWMNRRR